MHRVLAGAIAILLGLALCALMIWFWVGGASRDSSESLGWTLIVGMFALPVLAIPMAFGLLLLEGVASWLKKPRVRVLIAGGVVMPLLLVLIVGGPYLLLFFLNPENAGRTILLSLIMGAAAIAPCATTSAVYALLTRHSVDRA